jgi:lysylphosphatidylglycerol synthetase-like protein (DUF2156 family)
VRGNRLLFRLYVALAVIGAIFPWIIFVPWLAEHGFAPGRFTGDLFATRPAAIFASDVLVAAAIFILFVFVEGRRLRIRHLWLPVLLVFACGLCSALPAFLAQRERALAAR